MPRSTAIAISLMTIFLISPVVASASDPVITISSTGGAPSNGAITVTFADSTGRTYTETAVYGTLSTPGSIAAEFGALFTRDYICPGLGNCASGLGAVGSSGPNGTGLITFQLNGGQGFGPVTITPSGAGLPFVATGNNFQSQLPTTISLTANPGQSYSGNKVNFTASVSPSTTTGTVSFSDGGTVIGSSGVANGVSTFTFSTLSVGIHQITATYNGDASNAPSPPSTAQMVTVGPNASTLSLTQGPVSMGFVITGQGFGSPQPTSTVTINGTPATLVSGTWTDGSITVQVPQGASSGDVIVKVNNLQSKGGMTFTVIPPFQCPTQ